MTSSEPASGSPRDRSAGSPDPVPGPTPELAPAPTDTAPGATPAPAPQPDHASSPADADRPRRSRRRPADAPQPVHGTAEQVEQTLRARLGLRPLAEVPDPRSRMLGWLVPAVLAVFAALLRLPRLGVPGRLAFDETYYVKDAYGLLALGYEGDWIGDDANDRFRSGDFGALTEDPDYVVHPPLGKWLIAIGMRLLGPENPESWRISAAVAGILMVVLVTVLAGRLFRSPLLGGVAGLLLAVDGMAITASRIGLLDGFLAVGVLAGTLLVVQDRLATRAVLARRAAREIARTGTGLLPTAGAPSVGIRWWLVAAGVVLGASCGVKWSAAYAIAVLGIVVFVWDTAARRAVGARNWLSDGVWRGGTPAFFALVPTAAFTYLASWASWFASSGGFHRSWAADQRAAGTAIGYPGWLPDSLVSWWDYHRMMMDFHTGLVNPHNSQGHPMLWLLQLRPTLFYRAGGEERETLGMCGDGTCIAGITSIGNPLLWWLAVVGLGLVLYGALRVRDWRAWLVLSGYLSMWLPWVVLYSHRTIFQFYAIAFAPFVVLALTYGLGWVLGILRPPDDAPVLRGDDPESALRRWWRRRLHLALPVPWRAPEEEATADAPTAVPASAVGPTSQAGPDAAVGPAAEVAPDAEVDPAADATPDTRVGLAAHRRRRPPLVRLLVSEDASIALDRPGWITLGIVLVAIIGVSAFFYPAWTAWNLPEWAWEMRNWSG